MIPVHLLVVILVFAADDLFPPAAVVQVPPNCPLDTVGKLRLGQPAQLIVDLRRVDGVAQVVALAVGHEGDEVLALVQLVHDQLHDVDVRHLVVAAHVVDFADAALAEDQVDGLAVVLHIEPVADVLALAVDRQRLVVQAVGDHQRDQLLREVVGPVVVGAAADCHRQAVGTVVGLHQQVRAGLGGAVRRAGVDGRFLRKEQVGAVQRQVAVDLVRADLVVADVAVLPAGVHHDAGAEDVGLQEDARILDGAVHVALRREVDDRVGLFFLEDAVDGVPVADVGLAEAEVGLVHHGCQRGQVARIGQLIDAGHPISWVVFHVVMDKVSADKSGAAGDDDCHSRVFPSRGNCILLFHA